ncbi:MAG: endonuclease domain-containing protein [Minisyncoccia bacterium]
MQFINNKPQLKKFRQSLRKEMPVYEKLLWQKIRNRQLRVKFRRQFSIENFIIDFYCCEARLGIEIDGDSHFIGEEAILKDKARDETLFKKYKIKVLRFKNTEIAESLEGCINKILEEIPPLTPPKRGRIKTIR